MLGFDAIGILPLGGIPSSSGSSGAGVLVGVGSTGYAGSISVAVGKPVSGAAATGYTGQFVPSVAVVVVGVGGEGYAGSASDASGRILDGVSAVGAAGQFIPTVSIAITGVGGAGAAGGFAGSGAHGIVGVGATGYAGGIIPHVYAFIEGVGGEGHAGSAYNDQTRGVTGAAATGYAGDFTPKVSAYFAGVTAIGYAGAFTANPGGHLNGVSGDGQAGRIMVGISGGGTSRRLDDADEAPRRRRRPRTGFEPIAKQPDRKVGAKRKPLLPPPDLFGHGVVVPAVAPPVADLVAGDAALALAQAIATAQYLSDINRLLAGFDADDQDVADILDVLALID